MTTRTLLIAARALLAPAGAWTQGTAARDIRGLRVPPRHAEAVCWCPYGALVHCTPAGAWEQIAAARRPLEAALGGQILEAWNDEPGRTPAEVLALFDRALEASQ